MICVDCDKVDMRGRDGIFTVCDNCYERATRRTNVINNEVSYEGLTEAETLHALYHGTRPLGMGLLHDDPSFSVEDAEEVIADYPKFSSGTLSFDYVRGRPIKVSLEPSKKLVVHVWLYDRDAGDGACAGAIARALANKAKAAEVAP